MSIQEVNHPRYGSGIVKLTRNNGFLLLVSFQDGMSRWVKITEITQGKTQNTIGRITKSTTYSQERLKKRRMIEAFRMGIVPYDCVTDFTFGRHQETETIMNWLNSSDDGSLFVIGEYGTGKTHLVHYAIGYALQNDYAVAWVEMDPNEVPFYQPKLVYKYLVKNFIYPDKNSKKPKGFRDFIKDVVIQNLLKDNFYIKHMRNHLNDDMFWEWIEGKEVKKIYLMPTLYKSFTAANVYCYLLSSYGWAVTQLGLRGLLLIFDEAETVAMSYYSYQDKKSKNFISSLIRTARNDEQLLKTPGNSGLDYCGTGEGPSIPFLYKLPSGLKLLFAFTSLDWNIVKNYSDTYMFFSEIKNTPQLHLTHLSIEHMGEIFAHVCRLYEEAYEFKLNPQDSEKVFDKLIKNNLTTRFFVKGSVEGLDILRLGNEKHSDDK